MQDPKDRFVTLPPQAVIQPLEPEPVVAAEARRARGPLGALWHAFRVALKEIIGGLLPYLLVSAVLILAIAVFFGVSVKAAIILLGLGAVGLGALFAATQG